jgi:hypothetical protein
MPSVRETKTRFQNETRQVGAQSQLPPAEFTAPSLRSERNFNQLGSGVARPQRIHNFELCGMDWRVVSQKRQHD